jgi:RNA polymerase sigma factor for flagellar operon FliA
VRRLLCNVFLRDQRQLFLHHLPLIERVAMHACRRRGFGREETQDFVSHVKVKLIEDEYAIIRKFQGKSSIETYLTVVINRLFLDHLNQRWGKWRPSEEAKRLGPLAIQLDRLLHRDRLPLSEAIEILLTNYRVEVTRQELEDLAAKLPSRPPRPEEVVDEVAQGDVPTKELSPDDRLRALEGRTRLEEILEMVKEVLAQLPAEDALLAQMSCEFKISEIARRLHLEQKPLYRRLEKILKALRQELERRGVRPDEIGGLLSIREDDHEPRE